MRHPNVIRFLEVFESNKQVNMVLEHAAGGDLLRLVKKRKRLDEALAAFYFRQILDGLAA